MLPEAETFWVMVAYLVNAVSTSMSEFESPITPNCFRANRVTMILTKTTDVYISVLLDDLFDLVDIGLVRLFYVVKTLKNVVPF